MASDTGAPGPGWYPDPWFTGQHRWWDGRVWTGDVFPHGPTGPSGGDPAAPHVTVRPDGERPPVPPPSTRSAVPPPAPTWAYAAPAPAPTATAVLAPWEMLESGPPDASRRRLTPLQISALALAAGLVLGFVVVESVVSHSGHRSSANAVVPAPVVPLPGPSAPFASPSAPASTDRSAGLLQGLVVRQQDVRSGNQVQLLSGGNLVTGETTLDLCNGTFPSESSRTARLQVVEYDDSGTSVLSTEAVLYRQPADAAQGMRELQSVAAACPDHPVVSPVNEPTVTTRFGPAPDSSWPDVAGVQRLAFSFTTTDDVGSTNANVAVYLRRGRLLEGLYFPAPAGAQPPVQGQTTIASIVHVFEQRIAALPASAIGG